MNGWERLDKKLEQYMTDFPHLEAPRLRFRERIELGLELMAQQAFHMAGKQEVTQRLQELLTDGRKLATRRWRRSLRRSQSSRCARCCGKSSALADEGAYTSGFFHVGRATLCAVYGQGNLRWREEMAPPRLGPLRPGNRPMSLRAGVVCGAGRGNRFGTGSRRF
ncbi:MAG TPA: hypothetical protein VF756_04505 [Thermoanaerobaculia bacterium]